MNISILRSNPTKIPFLVGLIILLLSVGLWVQAFSSTAMDLQRATEIQLSQTKDDLENEIENKVQLIEKILIAEWVNVNSTEELFDRDKFYQLIPEFYNFFTGYLSINLVTANGTVLYVYPLEPNSSLINRSILYNVDGSPNLTIRKANETGEIALSTLVTFFQGGKGLSSYIPFYYNQTVHGYFNVVFRTDPLFSAYIQNHQILDDYNFVVEENSTVVYRHGNVFGINNRYVKQDIINYYDRSWDIYMTPSDELIDQASPLSHTFILLSGIIVTLLVFSLSSYLVRLNILVEEKRQKEQEYEELLRQFDKMNSLGTMAGGMAHDFNNILMIIQGNLSLLQDRLGSHLDEDDIVDIFDTIDTAVQEGRDLTQQILAFSRHQVIENQQIEIVELIENEIELFKSGLIKDINVEFNADIDQAYVFANPTSLNQIIINILQNAEQAIEDTGRISVVVSIQEGDLQRDASKMVHIVIEDTGKGIPPHILTKIFDPFFTTKDIGKGSGLGLAIAYSYLNSIEGRIEADSVPGQGSSINIYLPVVDPQDYKAQDTIDLTQVKTNCKSVLFDQFGPNPSVLIVEDDNYIASVIEEMYRFVGCEVTHVDHGDKALELLLNGSNPNLLILDVNLPGMNGVELFKKIRKKGDTQFILFVTGFAEQLQLIDIDAHKTVSYLIKPFSQEELYLKTIELLELSK